VDAEGPLARLKNLLFNKQTLLNIAQWVTVSRERILSVLLYNMSCRGALIYIYVPYYYIGILVGRTTYGRWLHHRDGHVHQVLCRPHPLIQPEKSSPHKDWGHFKTTYQYTEETRAFNFLPYTSLSSLFSFGIQVLMIFIKFAASRAQRAIPGGQLEHPERATEWSSTALLCDRRAECSSSPSRPHQQQLIEQ
jgi:hypothetical protein